MVYLHAEQGREAALPYGSAGQTFSMPLPPDQFVALLTRAQPQIYGFIGRMVIDRTDADDVLQETNMALWKLADQFQEGTDFVAWACRVAYYRVLEHRTAAKRLRIRLNDAMLELLATISLDENRLDSLVAAEEFEARRSALAACLDELPRRNRELLADYYGKGRSLGDIGTSLGRNANAVAQLFHRIRAILRTCVKGKLGDTG